MMLCKRFVDRSACLELCWLCSIGFYNVLWAEDMSLTYPSRFPCLFTCTINFSYFVMEAVVCFLHTQSFKNSNCSHFVEWTLMAKNKHLPCTFIERLNWCSQLKEFVTNHWCFTLGMKCWLNLENTICHHTVVNLFGKPITFVEWHGPLFNSLGAKKNPEIPPICLLSMLILRMIPKQDPFPQLWWVSIYYQQNGFQLWDSVHSHFSFE